MTTLHTNNSIETLGRMIDMGGEPYLIASTVVCILAQRLVRVICPQCKEPYQPTDEEIFALGFTPEEAARHTFYHGKGCNNCRNTGTKGRVGVFELLVNTHRMRELITRGAPAHELARQARTQGMRTMLQDGIDKVLRGITTPTEVIHAVYTSAGLDAMESGESGEPGDAPQDDADDDLVDQIEPAVES